MFETPYAVAFISTKKPPWLRAPAMKFMPPLKSVSLKSNRFRSFSGSTPLTSTCRVAVAKPAPPAWLRPMSARRNVGYPAGAACGAGKDVDHVHVYGERRRHLSNPELDPRPQLDVACKDRREGGVGAEHDELRVEARAAFEPDAETLYDSLDVVFQLPRLGRDVPAVIGGGPNLRERPSPGTEQTRTGTRHARDDFMKPPVAAELAHAPRRRKMISGVNAAGKKPARRMCDAPAALETCRPPHGRYFFVAVSDYEGDLAAGRAYRGHT